MRPLVKICGLMRAEDARMCVRHGVDIAGFVVEYPHPVPWNLDVATAQRLLTAVAAPAKTCVVTGGPPEKIYRLALATRPDYLQLHCRETLADTAYLARAFAPRGVKIIKTLFPDTPDLEQTAAAFCAAGASALLFDPRTPDNAVHGGAADLAVFARLQRAVSCPVILAGGITPANVADMVRQARPRIIDLMTGVEPRPGMKDEAKVAALFRALREMESRR